MPAITDDKLLRSERGLPPTDADSSSSKEHPQHVDHAHDHDTKAAPAIALDGERTFQAPEWIRNLTPEERHSVEAKLKRKLDTRLMPMIVLMYIMNYLDRVGINVTSLRV